MSDSTQNLTDGRHLARNVLWNLLGIGTPLVVAIGAIPVLIHGLGTARFGVLTIAWLVVGYFSLFDFGVGRALTKIVAEKLEGESKNEILGLIWTAIILTTIWGVFGAIIIVCISPWLVSNVFNIDVSLQPETLTAFYVLGASVPVVIGTIVLRGILEAYQRFRLINFVRIPLGIFTFLGPIVVLPFSNSLVPAVAVLVAARVISWFAYAALCFRVEPGLRHRVRIDLSGIRPLISFGGWMTASNLISQIMMYLDRFVISIVISMTAVTYYTTPFEVAARLWIIPGAIMGVLFPAFAATIVTDRTRATTLFDRAVNYIFLFLFPLALVIVTFAHEGLTLWLGMEFADKSSTVLQLLTVGIFINSHGHVPFGMIQGAGRPDIVAKLHIMELPFYLFLLWWMIGVYGIVGAAIAWVARVAFDTLILFVIARRFLSVSFLFSLRSTLTTGTAFFVLVVGAVIPGVTLKGLFLIVVLTVFLISAWFVILDIDERTVVRNRIKLIRISGR